MPCRTNLQCEQHTMTEAELLAATARKLREIKPAQGAVILYGSTPVCAACALHKMAHWLDELRQLKSEK